MLTSCKKSNQKLDAGNSAETRNTIHSPPTFFEYQPRCHNQRSQGVGDDGQLRLRLEVREEAEPQPARSIPSERLVNKIRNEENECGACGNLFMSIIYFFNDMFICVLIICSLVLLFHSCCLKWIVCNSSEKMWLFCGGWLSPIWNHGGRLLDDSCDAPRSNKTVCHGKSPCLTGKTSN